MAIIRIEDMRFYAFHGCFEEERAIGTYFRVDMALQVDTTKAQGSDSLEDTVNYLSVYQTAKGEMEKPSRLLEHVAERIATAVLAEYAGIEQVRVKVSKLNPPLGGRIGAVSVEIEKCR